MNIVLAAPACRYKFGIPDQMIQVSNLVSSPVVPYKPRRFWECNRSRIGNPFVRYDLDFQKLTLWKSWWSLRYYWTPIKMFYCRSTLLPSEKSNLEGHPKPLYIFSISDRYNFKAV